MNPWLISIPLAYLLGSIPCGYLLIRVFRKQDIRTVGSGNIGATNVLRGGNKSLGIATLVLDVAKAAGAVLLARFLAPADGDLPVAAAIAAILGHCFPVWLGFRGGKGVASAVGAFFVLSWPTALSALAIFLIIVITTRFVSLASVVAAAAVPLLGLYFVPARTPLILLGFVGIPLLVILKHHTNIRRLLAGTENRFGAKKAVA